MRLETRYRIVTDEYLGYEVQWRYWWMPFYVQGAMNAHRTVDDAENYIVYLRKPRKVRHSRFVKQVH